MAGLFLSYNHQDQTAVLAIRERLELRGIRTFFDKDQLVKGLPWPQALEQALTSARAVAVFLGPHDFGLWQKREMFFALDLQVQAERERRQFPVIPVLLKDAEPQPGFLFQNAWADFRNPAGEEEALEVLIRAVQQDERTPERAMASICPYLGLRTFREEDQSLYFGREAFVTLLAGKIAHQPVVAVVGPSGSGKSSVVLAGLLPALRRQRPPSQTWDAISFTPGDNPWWALAHALVSLLEPDLPETQLIEEAAVLSRALLERDGAMAGTFKRVLERSRGTDRLLVVVDQFEEMFTLAQERKQERAFFLEDLLASPKSAPVTIVLTLRADYYSHALNASRELSEALNTGQVALGPMVTEELRQAVMGPAGRVGLEFERGLVNRILEDVGGEPGNLPLLEYALTQLWQKRRDRMLTSRVYDGFGGVAGAIGDKADRVYNQFSEAEKNACRALFGRLVHVSPADTEGSDTRQRATRPAIGEAGWQIASTMAGPQLRLVVIGRDSQTGLETAEVAHEALIRNWKQLREWLKDDRSFLLWRQHLEVFLSIWATSGANTEDALLRGPALDEALKWRKLKDGDLNTREREFIAASQAAREQSGRRKLRTRRMAAALAILALTAGLAWFGYTQTARYQIDRIIADAPWKPLSENADNDLGSKQAVLEYMSALTYIRPDTALGIAQNIQSPSVQVEALVSIAKAQATSGRFAEALRAALEIQDPSGQADALRSLASAQASAGQFAEALRTAERIRASSRAAGFGSIAQAQAAAGEFTEALQTARRMPSPYVEAVALSSIAQGLAAAGQSAEAAKSWAASLSAIRKIEDPGDQAIALIALARAQAAAGRFDDAWHTAQNLDVRLFKTAALSSIAQAQAAAGQDAATALTVQEIDDQDLKDQVSILASIAQIQSTAGHRASAAKNFDAALHIAQKTQSPFFQAGALSIIAQAQAGAGQFSEALNTAGDDPAIRSSTLASIAAAQAKAHHWKAARITAIPCFQRDRLKAYAQILGEYAQADNPKLKHQLEAQRTSLQVLENLKP